MESSECRVCGANDWQRINTLKHWWYFCCECNSAWASRKDRYLFSSRPVAAIIMTLNRLAGGKLRFLVTDLLKDRRVIEDESVRYAQYAHMLQTGAGLSAWANDVDAQVARLEQFGIEYRGKRILCISGGPGLFARKLSESATVVVTEFSDGTVAMMRQHLGVDAVRYDLNSDRLEQVVSGKFDLVIAASVVNFCVDQETFVTSLTSILNPGATVIVSNDVASLGYLLTWQFEDYIPTTFLHNQAFLNLFYKSGRFRVVGRYKNKYNAYRYRVSIGGWRNKIAYVFRTPFWMLYGVCALLPWKNLNRKWWSLNHFSVLRFEADA